MQTTMRPDNEVEIRIVPLSEAGGHLDVGGKAARLGELMRRGEHVPDGFSLIGSGERAVSLALEAYRRMGSDTPVAVRSSASAEDGTDASFAGQFETVLDVRGEEAGRRVRRAARAGGSRCRPDDVGPGPADGPGAGSRRRLLGQPTDGRSGRGRDPCRARAW